MAIDSTLENSLRYWFAKPEADKLVSIAEWTQKTFIQTELWDDDTLARGIKELRDKIDLIYPQETYGLNFSKAYILITQTYLPASAMIRFQQWSAAHRSGDSLLGPFIPPDFIKGATLVAGAVFAGAVVAPALAGGGAAAASATAGEAATVNIPALASTTIPTVPASVTTAVTGTLVATAQNQIKNQLDNLLGNKAPSPQALSSEPQPTSKKNGSDLYLALIGGASLLLLALV